MDYRPAYGNLMELFPQVDSRILKAVAIEHSNDVDAAVEFILYEVLPSLSGPSDTVHNDHVVGPSDNFHDDHEVSNAVQLREHDVNNQGAEAVQPESIECETAISGDSAGFESPLGGVADENMIDLEADDRYSSLTKLKSPFGGVTEDNIIDLKTDDCHSSLTILEEHPDMIGYGSLVKDFNGSVSECEEQLSMCSVQDADTVSVALESAHDALLSVNAKNMESVECGAEVPEDINVSFGEIEDHFKCLAKNHPEQLACGIKVVSLEEDDLPMILSTRSGHVVNIDLLEECVTDGKNNKKTLVSAVESVVNMMKEAEILEERAKQTKEEVSLAGQDVLTKVEDLKQMIQHAKQANDMHTGEVYGEKSILSTEARELQSRLFNLSDERKKSFSIIEEIRVTLEARLAVARDEIAAAEQEKLEKEGLAQKALKEQEAFMDTIVQESRKLQQEAEENAKLREFLVDRGRVVDTLQGEIAVICEDVMLLKKRVDERAPLKGSLLMTTYSSASSSSSFSHKSIASADELLLPAELGENPTESNEDHLRSQEPEKIITVCGSEKADASGKQKSASDDEWEFLKHDVCPF